MDERRSIKKAHFSIRGRSNTSCMKNLLEAGPPKSGNNMLQFTSPYPRIIIDCWILTMEQKMFKMATRYTHPVLMDMLLPFLYPKALRLCCGNSPWRSLLRALRREALLLAAEELAMQNPGASPQAQAALSLLSAYRAAPPKLRQDQLPKAVPQTCQAWIVTVKIMTL